MSQLLRRLVLFMALVYLGREKRAAQWQAQEIPQSFGEAGCCLATAVRAKITFEFLGYTLDSQSVKTPDCLSEAGSCERCGNSRYPRANEDGEVRKRDRKEYYFRRTCAQPSSVCQHLSVANPLVSTRIVIMAVELLSGKVFLVVTGASQGIGAEIAFTFGHLLQQGSQVLLLARNADRLKETAAKLPKHLKVDHESVDLSVATADVLDGILKKHLGADGPKNFERAVIVHNAASIGDVSKTTIEMTDCDEWRKYYDLNVFSPAVLNSVFMKIFNDDTKVGRLVINITSLACVEPMKSMGFYGSGKAAREMYFKIFALEFPQVNVLNYSPGPVDTEMFDTVVEKSSDPAIRTQFGELKEQKTVLTTRQSVDRLVMVLKDQKYKTGEHVDYYDQL